jgi:hypothetical protein
LSLQQTCPLRNRPSISAGRVFLCDYDNSPSSRRTRR